MIDAMIQAATAPFQSQVGMHGFAYGLLGFKTLSRMYEFIKERNGSSKE